MFKVDVKYNDGLAELPSVKARTLEQAVEVVEIELSPQWLNTEVREAIKSALRTPGEPVRIGSTGKATLKITQTEGTQNG